MPHDLNAWHLVALGAGATLVHAYHTIVNAGGLKAIWRNFWNGPRPTSLPPASTKNTTAADYPPL
jgi:hypothetical protein